MLSVDARNSFAIIVLHDGEGAAVVKDAEVRLQAAFVICSELQLLASGPVLRKVVIELPEGCAKSRS